MGDQGNFIEFENLLGEPLREGLAAGVQMPTLQVLYGIATAIQWRTKEERGLVEIPKKRSVSEN
jgi:ketopantoate reductase